MSSTLSVCRAVGGFFNASSYGFTGEFASLFGREATHAFLATDLTAARSLFYEEIANVLW
jgi:hypothetical protein